VTDTPPWTAAPLVALDLEGTGAQDREREAILEIAVVPVAAGRPVPSSAYTSLINPGRPIPRRPWISPGLTDAVLADAPPLSEVEPHLAELLDGCWIVGHNVMVDWRLLHRRCPSVRPAGLIDTLRLARAAQPGIRGGMGLSALLERHGLTEHVTAAVPDGQPHRALWDTVAAAVLLSRLVADRWPASPPTLSELAHLASLPFDAAPAVTANDPQPDTLF
jgi:DNA polymerase III subunit epsilon